MCKTRGHLHDRLLQLTTHYVQQDDRDGSLSPMTYLVAAVWIHCKLCLWLHSKIRIENCRIESKHGIAARYWNSLQQDTIIPQFYLYNGLVRCTQKLRSPGANLRNRKSLCGIFVLAEPILYVLRADSNFADSDIRQNPSSMTLRASLVVDRIVPDKTEG
jgi:hypothetical protein